MKVEAMEWVQKAKGDMNTARRESSFVNSVRSDNLIPGESGAPLPIIFCKKRRTQQGEKHNATYK